MNMTAKTAVWTLATLACLPTGVGVAQNYVIDNSHTSIIFGVSHLGYSYTYGRFNQTRGNYMLDPANPAASQFQLLIDATSIDTNDQKRDEHLKGPDFFSVKQFPVISFQSTSVKVEKSPEGGEIYNISGKLTLHGVTRDVTLPVQKLGEGPGPRGNDYRSGFICKSQIKRSDYGMSNMVPHIGDEIAITVSFEGIRQDAAVPPPAQ